MKAKATALAEREAKKEAARKEKLRRQRRGPKRQMEAVAEGAEASDDLGHLCASLIAALACPSDPRPPCLMTETSTLRSMWRSLVCSVYNYRGARLGADMAWPWPLLAIVFDSVVSLC
jgi:hypothetical protein